MNRTKQGKDTFEDMWKDKAERFRKVVLDGKYCREGAQTSKCGSKTEGTE